ncbi:hypothetical protein GCM10010182_01060 [Actinomadura cremea]|nr:hypothetical protein GCM10010182_01060 [Actinomadura cremea]
MISSALGEVAGYGMDESHHAFYWGAKLMLITTAEGAVCAFSLAHPKELDVQQAVRLLHVQRAPPGPCPIVCDKGFAGAEVEKAAADLGHVLIRPADGRGRGGRVVAEDRGIAGEAFGRASRRARGTGAPRRPVVAGRRSPAGRRRRPSRSGRSGPAARMRCTRFGRPGEICGTVP